MKKLLNFITGLILITSLIFTISGCEFLQYNEVDYNGQLAVHIIDVGQGDSIYINLPNGKNMLIDGGDKNAKDQLLKYLDSKNAKKIDYCIATHPHADHIGSLDDVINKYNVSNIYMPKISANSKVFEDLLSSIKNKGLQINTAKSGKVIINEDSIYAEFIAPNKNQYDNTNDYSAVLKLKYANTTFLFMGDATKVSENEILTAGTDICADVIKIGHHGSDTSSSNKFLKAVKPKYAVISCGKDNSYNHPHTEILKRLDELNIKYFRTDLNGSIVFLSDGNNISVK